MAQTQQRYMLAKTSTITSIETRSRRECMLPLDFHPCLSYMSNMAFAFWGPFQALSHICDSKSREIVIPTTHAHKEINPDTRFYTYTNVSPLDQSIRLQSLCREWCSSAHKVKKMLFSPLSFAVSFQHVCPNLVQVTSPNGVKLRPWGQELSSGHKHPCFRTRTFFVFHCSAPVPLPQACRERSHLTASYVAIFSGYSRAYH